jgi:site-specific DNA recombinase
MTNTGNTGNTGKCAVYLRESIDAAGDAHNVGDQRAVCLPHAAKHGLAVARVYCDNDISAFTGKHRPGYQEMMAAAGRGEFTAIVLWQTSRLWRNRAERAAGIDLLSKAKVSIYAVQGPSLDLATASGRAMAGILGEFDTMESEVKKERQTMAAEQSARRGERWPGGHRPTGWAEEWITVQTRTGPKLRRSLVPHEIEAGAIREACSALLAAGRDANISAVARRWNALYASHGMRPPQAPYGPLPADPWSRQTVTAVLLNPCIAGLRYYKGEYVADGNWPAIVEPETWHSVVAILKDPARKPPKGVRTLLGGIATCECGNIVTGTPTRTGAPGYKCQHSTRPASWEGSHVTVRAAEVNEYVESVAIARLSRPDVADLVAPKRPDAAPLRERAAAIRRNLEEIAADRADGLMSRAEWLAAKERADARLAAIEAELATITGSNVLAPFASAESAAATWAALDLSGRRAVVRELMTVTLIPAGRGARVFDPIKRVVIEWREDAE